MSITLVNSADDVNGNQNSGASMTITSTTAGNTLVVLVVHRNLTDHVTSITDGGDTFVSANCLSTDSTGGQRAEIWYALGVAAGRTAVVVNTSGGGLFRSGVHEYSGSLRNLAFESAVKLDTIASSTTLIGPSIVTTGGNDVLVTVIGDSQGVSATVANGGFTFNAVYCVGGLMGIADLRNVTPGTYQPAFTSTPAGTGCCSMAAFTESPSGGAAPPQADIPIVY
jgi:hypothetical protein